MNRIVAVCLAVWMAVSVVGCADRQTSFLEVRMTGDARVYGQYFRNRNFTGWN